MKKTLVRGAVAAFISAAAIVPLAGVAQATPMSYGGCHHRHHEHHHFGHHGHFYADGWWGHAWGDDDDWGGGVFGDEKEFRHGDEGFGRDEEESGKHEEEFGRHKEECGRHEERGEHKEECGRHEERGEHKEEFGRHHRHLHKNFWFGGDRDEEVSGDDNNVGSFNWKTWIDVD